MTISDAEPTSWMYRGFVYHSRVRPTKHAFRYRVFSLYLDLDDLDSLESRIKFFSRNRWNLFSFYDADVGDLPAEAKVPNESTRAYVERQLHSHNIFEPAFRIKLLCYPRMLGYVFNPLAVFYCERENGEVFAVVNEVHNTFGERQVYVFPVATDSDQQVLQPNCKKHMHVSPFTPMNMRYQFNYTQPGNEIKLGIKASDSNGLMLSASVMGKRHTLRNSTLLMCLLLYPLMTFKVIIAIHWEAFFLWIKRVPWFAHQPKTVSMPDGQDATIGNFKD